ncbi:YlbL family protein [Gulosibacter sediminis]|uniref:YlbL family protein n=1 Tax=Gulosibacter sediminis TaxID=1729695 RepID=UPI0024A7D4B7|nr:PDZ domain-containing protein [Gulosibacter sediminis]
MTASHQHPEAALPDGIGDEKPARRRWSRERFGRWCLILGVVALVILAVSPAPYVIRQPGPAFNALGQEENDDGTQQDVIQISGAETYDTGDGSLYVMTVNIVGNPQSQPNWLQVLGAWMTPGKDVLPVEAYYPEGTTVDQRNEESALMMTQAQDTAIAAALTELGYDVTEQMSVASVGEDAAAAGELEVGDVIVTIDGKPITNTEELSALTLTEEPTEVVFTRDGKEHRVEITPKLTETDNGEVPLLGVQLQYEYEFPIDVSIDLGDVGGPSAGMMFALATYDKLTEGDLTGGDQVTGTGTMSDDGTVGAIGGIRQKMYEAVSLGADYFIAPEANCAEVLDGGIPGDMTVYAVGNLDEALDIIEANAADESTDGLRSCQDAVDAGVPQS